MDDVILVTGATGQVGGATLRELVARGVPVRALVRDRSSAADLEALPGVDIVQGNLADAGSLERALRRVDRVFFCPPPDPRMEALQRNLFQASARAGVRHVVHLSATCADENEPSVSLGGHGRGERELERSGVGWTHLRPNSFFQNTLFDAPSIKSENCFYACVGDTRFAKVDTRDVGAVAAVCLMEDGHWGTTYQVDGPEPLTYAQMAQILSDAVGRRIEYVDMPGEEYVQFLLREGFPDWLAEEFFLIYGQGPIRAGGAATATETVERLTGRPPRTFEAWAREHADAFASA